jgi:outer membrane biosynthesis protein TonB
VVVDKSGKVEKVNVLSGPAMEQQAAYDVAQMWTFKPMMVGAKAVQFDVKLIFSFSAERHRATGDLAP